MVAPTARTGGSGGDTAGCVVLHSGGGGGLSAIREEAVQEEAG